jgi:hypothetical protein
MVGVRFRRALFPGYSDSVQFNVPCAGSVVTATNGPAPVFAGKPDSIEVPAPSITAPATEGEYRIDVSLQYRKVDQFLLNFMYGETNTLTSPVTEIARTQVTVKVRPKSQAAVSRSAPASELAATP